MERCDIHVHPHISPRRANVEARPHPAPSLSCPSPEPFRSSQPSASLSSSRSDAGGRGDRALGAGVFGYRRTVCDTTKITRATRTVGRTVFQRVHLSSRHEIITRRSLPVAAMACLIPRGARFSVRPHTSDRARSVVPCASAEGKRILVLGGTGKVGGSTAKVTTPDAPGSQPRDLTPIRCSVRVFCGVPRACEPRITSIAPTEGAIGAPSYQPREVDIGVSGGFLASLASHSPTRAEPARCR